MKSNMDITAFARVSHSSARDLEMSEPINHSKKNIHPKTHDATSNANGLSTNIILNRLKKR